MSSLNSIFESRLGVFVASVLALLILALVVLALFRLVFGRRLRAPGGGRNRQPRLGIVDLYDLDKERQLVIVRRDNVEHLVMIGGPNDLLIESQIVRVEGRDSRGRDKEAPAGAPNWTPNAALGAGGVAALPPGPAGEPVFAEASAPAVEPVVVVQPAARPAEASTI